MHTVEEGTWSVAIKDYSKFGVKDVVHVTILDSVSHKVPFWNKWERFYEWKSAKEYTTSTKVNGFPAWEVYNEDLKDYKLYVGINDRFLVLIDTDNSDRDTLYLFANSIDYNGIAALGGGGGAPPAEIEQEQPTEKPTLPPTPTPTPTPKPPGFEAVFAIAGLLAVAYILRGRK
jgi:PGF-CTERM protein